MNNNLETIRIFSEDVIPVYDTDTGEKVVLGRELHERLKIKTAYKDWIKRMIDIGFVEGTDFSVLLKMSKTLLVAVLAQTMFLALTWQSTLR